MEKIPAGTGWLWVKQGFGLFRQQPGSLFMLFLIYALLMQLARVFQPLPQALSMLLAPMVSIAFMRACVHIEQQKRVLPILLLSGFEKPGFPRLLALGALCLLAALLTMGLATLIDGGVLFQIVTERIAMTEEIMHDSNVSTAALLTVVLYVPAAMAFCFAAPLIYWKKMGIGKAIFYSFFSVFHALKAFIVFAAAWFMISVISSQIVLLLVGQGALAVILLAPLSITMQCSLYASYKQLFGAPEETAPAPTP